MCTRHVKIAFAITLFVTFPAMAGAAEAAPIPVFFADNHAESFGWIARTFPLDTPQSLILVDAHSDASSVNHSDALREGLRRVRDREERTKKITAWLGSGRIQAFNWIEPLMPQPIDRVLWLAAPHLESAAIQALKIEAVEQVDSRIEFEARSAGALGERWQVVDLDGFGKVQAPELPVIASIDLDFFHGMRADEAEAAFAKIWKHLMSLPRLSGISFAVSRPWLADDAEAERLVLLALTAASDLENAEITVAYDDSTGPDHSLKAAEFQTKNEQIPRFDWHHPGPAVEARLALHHKNPIRLVVDDAAASVDGIWRMESDSPVVVRVVSENISTTGRTRWSLLEPGTATVDLLPESGLGKNFSPENTGRAVWQRRRSLGESKDGAWRLDIPGGTAGWGRWRVEAEVETENGWQLATLCEIRVQSGSGFRRALSGQFRAPYVFGIGLVRQDGLTGPETGMGYDCANFLIAAWRETGRWLPWSDPGDLQKQLVTVADGVTVDDPVPLDPGAIEHGVVIDFGAHVAALWEDMPPAGILNREDVLAHHLGGFPELKSLSELAATRGTFAVRRLGGKVAATIWFGGDVVLATDAPDLSAFAAAQGDPLVINLEGVGVREAKALPGRYRFVFPATHLQALQKAGVTAVSLANNHAGDAGAAGFQECVDEATAIGPRIAGARNTDAPLICKSPTITLLAASLFPSNETDDFITLLPRDADIIAEKIRTLRATDSSVVIMLHGGDEYAREVNDEQRKWARWCVDQGAALVVFSHPHVTQPLEAYRGRPVAFSLGNLVYPRALQGADDGAWLRIDFSKEGNVLAADLIPLP